jgi:molybdenum cofactor cytidylyltransferase
MGQPKQLLAVAGQSLLRRAVQLAMEVADSTIVVLGARAELLANELHDLDVTIVLNNAWQMGMGTSVRAGMSDIPPSAEAVLFVLCDQPQVTSAHLRDLIQAWRSSGHPIAASGYEGVAGVPALFSRSCFADLMSLDPRSGAKQLLQARPQAVAVVPFDEAANDIDTPEDYRLTLLGG